MVRPAGVFSNRYTLDDMPDLSGKVAVVVGGSRGIGEAVVSALVQKGAEGKWQACCGRPVLIPAVHIISATEEHAQEAIEHIASTVPNASDKIKKHTVDISDLHAVISLSQSLARDLPRLHILYLIAGIGVSPWGLTKSGLGNHFGINNVSQMAITDVLLPLMRRTSAEEQGTSKEENWSTRIVSESSELHRWAPGDARFESLEEVSEGSKDMDPTKLYGRSKLGK
jgi:NAD(P)-dependent dehydrogenase (short-subunit alcohol dehydrogenase family)